MLNLGIGLGLLIIGDSQTGGHWATSYFGDFLQKCLKRDQPEVSFEMYGRGGTQPIHWLSNASLDRIPTLHRNASYAHENLGGSEAPVSVKRLPTLLSKYAPRNVLLFFGDNLLNASESEIHRQYELLLNALDSAGIEPEHCLILTPTFEMAVKDHRNVPSKDLGHTLKVNAAIRKAVGSRCQVKDGIDLMKESTLRDQDTLRRIAVPGTSGCQGAASNDNIHLCGEAAREFAEKVCQELKSTSGF